MTLFIIELLKLLSESSLPIYLGTTARPTTTSPTLTSFYLGVMVWWAVVIKFRAGKVPMRVSSSALARSVQRVSATIPISLLLEWEGAKTEHDAYTVDLSSRGVRLRTTFVLFPEERVGIVPLGDATHAIPSRVVWVERSSASGCLAGIEFLATLPV